MEIKVGGMCWMNLAKLPWNLFYKKYDYLHRLTHSFIQQYLEHMDILLFCSHFPLFIEFNEECFISLQHF